ncbi:MAG: hypothetical protein QOH42_2664, partial [Blastocatellia bacterium]|nr:hypothetical protein [Blastocatellia bacterium]
SNGEETANTDDLEEMILANSI